MNKNYSYFAVGKRPDGGTYESVDRLANEMRTPTGTKKEGIC